MILNSVSVLPARRCRQQCSLALVCLSDCQVRGEPPRGAGPPAWEEGCLWRAEAAAAAPLWLRVIPSRSARRTVYPSGVPTARRRGHRASWEETCWRDRWVTPTRRFYSVTLECSRPVGDKRPFVNMRRTTHVKNILWVKGCICVAELLRSRSCYVAAPWAATHIRHKVSLCSLVFWLLVCRLVSLVSWQVCQYSTGRSSHIVCICIFEQVLQHSQPSASACLLDAVIFR